jgi:ATP-binding cassette, subfamily B, bacterial PglK
MINYISQVLYILSGSKIRLIILLVGFTICSVLEAVGIGLIGPFINLASNRDLNNLPPYILTAIAKLNINSSSELLLVLGLAIIAFFCVKSILYFVTQAYIYHFSSNYKANLALRLLKAYLSVNYEFHLTRNTASLIKNIVIETNQFYFYCLLPLLKGISNLAVICFLLVLLALTDLRLLAMILLVLLPIFLLFNLFRNKFRKWGKMASQSQQGMIRTINHAMGGLKETKVIGCESHFEQEMKRQVKEYARSTTFSQSSQALPKILIETALMIFIISFVIISQLSSSQSMEEVTGILGVFAVAAMRLIPSASQLIQAASQMQTGAYTLSMLYADLKDIDRQQSEQSQEFLSYDGEFDLAEVARHQKSITFCNTLELQNVTYNYTKNSEPALKNISFNISRGELIALIGKSGAGKTTLVDVILGLLQPEKGDILADGESIYQNIRSWQDLVGYIPQSIFLVDDTVERNIAFGVPNSKIDSAKLERVIKVAQLGELVEQLPNGIKTQVGERGIRLSGGQRQRIGIARALYHEREILVLDEATAALDNETESLISEAINSLAGQKTLIIIAHRLSTVKNCDRIYLLEKGRIVNSGTYQEVVMSKLNV